MKISVQRVAILLLAFALVGLFLYDRLSNERVTSPPPAPQPDPLAQTPPPELEKVNKLFADSTAFQASMLPQDRVQDHFAGLLEEETRLQELAELLNELPHSQMNGEVYNRLGMTQMMLSLQQGPSAERSLTSAEEWLKRADESYNRLTAALGARDKGGLLAANARLRGDNQRMLATRVKLRADNLRVVVESRKLQDDNPKALSDMKWKLKQTADEIVHHNKSAVTFYQAALDYIRGSSEKGGLNEAQIWLGLLMAQIEQDPPAPEKGAQQRDPDYIKAAEALLDVLNAQTRENLLSSPALLENSGNAANKAYNKASSDKSIGPNSLLLLPLLEKEEKLALTLGVKKQAEFLRSEINRIKGANKTQG